MMMCGNWPGAALELALRRLLLVIHFLKVGTGLRWNLHFFHGGNWPELAGTRTVGWMHLTTGRQINASYHWHCRLEEQLPRVVRIVLNMWMARICNYIQTVKKKECAVAGAC